MSESFKGDKFASAIANRYYDVATQGREDEYFTTYCAYNDATLVKLGATFAIRALLEEGSLSSEFNETTVVETFEKIVDRQAAEHKIQMEVEGAA